MSWILAEPGREPIEFVCLDDALVRSQIGICGHAGHVARTTVVTLAVFSPARGVIEASADATHCPWCRRYYMLDNDFDRLSAEGVLCCQAIASGSGAAGGIRSVSPGLADQPFFHSLGYCIGKREDLPSGERRAILDFAIANGFRSQDEVIAFLGWLVDFNGGRKGADAAVKRWRDDIAYLESGRLIDGERLKIGPDFLPAEGRHAHPDDTCDHCR